jgi:hypothetical protein
MPQGKYMELEQDGPRFRELGDLILFVRALPLARRAQAVLRLPLPEVVAAMAAAGGRENRVRKVRVAAGRACSRYGRWFGGLDSCLTRSLVAGALLSSTHDVVLHVGFRPGEAEPPADGHAWLTVNGERIDVAPPDTGAGTYDEVLRFPFLNDRRSGT